MELKKQKRDDTSILIQTWGDYEFRLFPGTKNTKPYVHFQYLNPNTGKEERIRKLANLKPGSSLQTLKKNAKVSVEALIELLQAGWNPCTKKFNGLSITPLSSIKECVEYWLKEREKAVRVNAIGEKALKGNRYLMTYFTDWLSENQFLYRKPKTFTRIDVDNFLQFTAYKRNWNKVSYNTYRTDLGTFFSHLATLKIIPDNPVRYSEKKNTKNDSSRFVIYEEDELESVVILLAKDKRYLGLYIAAKMVFKYNIRPIELTRIQVSDIDFVKMLLTLAPTKTKNGNEARFKLNIELSNLFKDLIADKPTHFFVFGHRCKPSTEQVNQDYFGQKFRSFKKQYKLPAHLKFYALKHSSDWYDLEDGVSLQTISERNRHANPNVTVAYVSQRLNKRVIEPTAQNRF